MFIPSPCHIMIGAPEEGEAPKEDGPRKVTPDGRERPKMSRFFPSLASIFASSTLSLSHQDPQMCTLGNLGLSCETPAVRKTPRFQTTVREPKRAHLGLRPSKNHQNLMRRLNEKQNEGKKRATFWAASRGPGEGPNQQPQPTTQYNTKTDWPTMDRPKLDTGGFGLIHWVVFSNLVFSFAPPPSSTRPSPLVRTPLPRTPSPLTGAQALHFGSDLFRPMPLSAKASAEVGPVRPRTVRPRRVEASRLGSNLEKVEARRVEPRRVGAQNFALFFHTPATIFFLSSFSLWNFGGVWSARTLKCARPGGWKNEKTTNEKKRKNKKNKNEEKWRHLDSHAKSSTISMISFWECVSFPKKINNPLWEVTVFPKKSGNFHWTRNKHTHNTYENQRKNR